MFEVSVSDAQPIEEVAKELSFHAERLGQVKCIHNGVLLVIDKGASPRDIVQKYRRNSNLK